MKIIKIQTPGKFLLNGLWLGLEKAETVFVYIHGLGGSVFAQYDLLGRLSLRKNTAVITFNNRGSGIVTRVKSINEKKKKGYDSHIIGQAHEVFTDCVDDIEGAIRFAQESGAKNIYLIGHSTGCQKSIYYLSKKIKTPVRGVLLLAPLSDYAGAVATTGLKMLEKAVRIARKMVVQGKSHDMMPADLCPYPHDAQRFLGLYTPDSVEEIFSYVNPSKKPMVLNKVKIPIIVVLAGDDEYSDRPITAVMDWFKNVLKKQEASFELIEGAPHNFTGFTDELIKVIVGWTKK